MGAPGRLPSPLPTFSFPSLFLAYYFCSVLRYSISQMWVALAFCQVESTICTFQFVSSILVFLDKELGRNLQETVQLSL